MATGSGSPAWTAAAEGSGGGAGACAGTGATGGAGATAGTVRGGDGAEGLTALSRRPMVGAAGCFVCGVLLHRGLADLPVLYLALAAGAAVGAIALRRLHLASTLSLAAALVLAGVAAGQIERFGYPAGAIGAYTRDAPVLAEVEVEIDQAPRVLEGQAVGGRPAAPRQVTGGVVRAVRTRSGWRAAAGRVALRVSPPNPDLAYGQRVAALGALSRPPAADNPGQFDWERYYREQRVLAVLEVRHAENVAVVRAAGPAPLNRLREGARAALARGFAPERAVDHALLRALFLGDADPQLRDVQDDFRRTGTSHHLAISGMHVAVLGGVVYGLCRGLRLRPRGSAAATMGFVLLYGLVALPSPPVVRSIVLCTAFGVGVACRRSVDGVQLLAFTVFAMLAWAPLDLYGAGFQLSFGTVLGLMLLATPLYRRMHRVDEDQRVLMSLGIAPGWGERVRGWAWKHLLAATAAGIVAWAVSAPLIVEHFDQLNPWAVPASILLAPTVLLALLAALLKVVLTLVLPFGAAWWAAGAGWAAMLMRNGVGLLARVPGSDLPLPAVSAGLVGAYYVLLFLPLVPTARPVLRRALTCAPAAAVLAVLLLPVLVGFAPRGGAEARVTLLSVGAGQCAVVEVPGGRVVVVDAGSATVADLERRTLAPFLRSRGISGVDLVLVSHANIDHFSAVAPAAEAHGRPGVVVPAPFDAHARRDWPARALLRRLAELKCPVESAAEGRAIDVGPGATLEVLWPPPPGDPALPDAARRDPNESSLVLKLTCRGRSVLFTGDIQGAAETALLRRGAGALRADVLVAPHHGSAEATTGAFLAAVNPATVLASCDRTPTGKQRAFDALCAGQGRALLRTSEHGAITVRIDPAGGLGLETFRKR